VIGGGVIAAGELLLAPAREVMLERALAPGKDVARVEAARFGPEAAGQALALVNHFDNLRLTLTALPLARQDAAHGGQAFAVLYDALQLKLGRRQLYGTQMATDAHGDTYVLPLEDPARVDQFLREIGAPPLARTLTEFRDAALPGKALPRIARDEEEDPGSTAEVEKSSLQVEK